MAGQLLPDLVTSVIVGDHNVGKTSLLIRLEHGKFPTEYIPRVRQSGAHLLQVDDKQVEFHMLDTYANSHPRLRVLNYPFASSFIVFSFAVDDENSLRHVIETWAPEVDVYGQRGLPRILVGTKQDMRAEAGAVGLIPHTAGLIAADRIGALTYMECSAKTGYNVDEVFQTAVRARRHAPDVTRRRKTKKCAVQ